MKIKYSRPRRLSDPFSDFNSESLAKLLATPDSELEWHDFQALLGPFLPAGTYTESVYFLSMAFDCLQQQKESALDLTTSVTWFVSKYADQLLADGLLEKCRSRIMKCLLDWTASFEVQHFDRAACIAKGWGRNYFDYVQRSEVICETLQDLDRFQRHSDLADHFLSRLVASQDPMESAWLLELAGSQNEVYRPPARDAFQRAFSDRALLRQRRSIVEEVLVLPTPSPTYWCDLFAKLGI